MNRVTGWREAQGVYIDLLCMYVLYVDLETAWSSGLCQPGPLGRLG